ncbi:MAG: hypothetical protein V4793_19645 [Paraburkholderia tropica]|uniref:hypothetical protein n=1 Tax=Paraburkholderia tropica TaxID=92647 RepID=UPI0011B3D2EA|nr:hypothetical protein [Paraburkholderia tropica]MDE1140434.1 hypothetical protein [Paraburkholderia tropica]
MSDSFFGGMGAPDKHGAPFGKPGILAFPFVAEQFFKTTGSFFVKLRRFAAPAACPGYLIDTSDCAQLREFGLSGSLGRYRYATIVA